MTDQAERTVSSKILGWEGAWCEFGVLFLGGGILLFFPPSTAPLPQSKNSHKHFRVFCAYSVTVLTHTKKKQAFYFLRAFLYSVPFLFPSFLFQCLLAKLCAGGQQFHKQCCLPSWYSQFKFYCGCAWFYLWHVGSSSLTRDGPRPPALGMRNLSHWTTRKSPSA